MEVNTLDNANFKMGLVIQSKRSTTLTCAWFVGWSLFYWVEYLFLSLIHDNNFMRLETSVSNRS